MIRYLAIVLVVAGTFTAAGCEEGQRTKSRRRHTPPRPEPQIMKVLRDVRPNRMTLIVGPKADDVEGDGQADVINVSVVLFDEPRPEPVIVPGSFEFEAVPMNAEHGVQVPPMRWRFDAVQARAAEGPTMFGLPGYRFQLDVRSLRRSPLPGMVVNIVGRFQPDDGGPPITCYPDQRLVRLGGTG